MRLPGRAIRSTRDTTTTELRPAAAWDELVGATGPVAVIRAQRAGDLAEHPEAKQVA